MNEPDAPVRICRECKVFIHPDEDAHRFEDDEGRTVWVHERCYDGDEMYGDEDEDDDDGDDEEEDDDGHPMEKWASQKGNVYDSVSEGEALLEVTDVEADEIVQEIKREMDDE